MNDFQKSTQNIKFNGHESVLLRIRNLESENRGLGSKVHNFLNYELSIPTGGLIALCTLFTLIFSLHFTDLTPETYAYSITVINERGFHEKTY